MHEDIFMGSKFINSAKTCLQNWFYFFINKVRLPIYKRVYCPDPHINWLGMDLKLLQWRSLHRGIQLILAHNIPNGLSDEKTERKLDSIGLQEDWIELIAQYTIALKMELQINEIAGLSEIDRESVDLERVKARRSLIRQFRDLNRFKPDLLLLAQGYGIDGTTARLLGAYFGIPVLSFENTAFKNRLVWESISGITVNRNIAANLFWRYEDTVSEEEAENYCSRIIAKTKESKKLEHASPDAQWTGASNRSMVLYLGQVYTDSSILYGSRPHLGPEQVVEKLAQYCMQNDFDLVLKLHPKEASDVVVPGTTRKYNKLTLRKLKTINEFDRWLVSDWLHVDSGNEWDTYGLIEAADIAVTINSQAGLEAAIRGTPVVTCGQCFYGNLGFTEDVSRPEDIENAINTARRMSKLVQRRIMSKKFFYIFFEKYCIEKSIPALISKIKQTCGRVEFITGAKGEYDA